MVNFCMDFVWKVSFLIIDFKGSVIILVQIVMHLCVFNKAPLSCWLLADFEFSVLKPNTFNWIFRNFRGVLWLMKEIGVPKQ